MPSTLIAVIYIVTFDSAYRANERSSDVVLRNWRLWIVGEAGLGPSFQALDDIEGRENLYAVAIKKLVSATFSSYTAHL